MTQISRPQPGRNTTYPDAGSYSADQWAQLLMISHVGEETGVTTAGRYTRGPYVSFLNRLEVTDDGAIITIDTGAGWVNGHLLIVGADDAADVDITPTAPVALARVDRVVMVQNNTNATYNTNLDTPAPYAAGVPAYSTRLAILQGVEGAGVPRALVNNANYWMVELAEYNIDILGAITGLTDYRDYVDAQICHEFAPAQSGYNVTDDTDIPHATLSSIIFMNGPGSIGGITLPDNKLSIAYGTWHVPGNVVDVDAINVNAVVISTVTANIYSRNWIYYGACAENFPHDDGVGYAAVALTANLQSCVQEVTPINLNIDDIMNLAYERDATNILDTLNSEAYITGWIISYIGYRR
jgi:hypothetical protein